MIAYIRRNATFMLFVLLCSASSLVLIQRVSGWENALSPVDIGSEANVLREVRHFLEDGVTKHHGLGNVTYPGMYLGAGLDSSFLADQGIDAAEKDYVLRHVVNPDGVYTHYPPGPEYLAFVAAKVLGLVPVWRLRLLPIGFGWIATLFLGITVYQRFGPLVGWIVVAAMGVTPSITTAFAALHDQGYALALTMIEIGLVVSGGTRLLPFAILGFLQGWLSFDQVFLVALMPVAIETIMPAIDDGYQPRWGLGVRRVMLAGGGFAFAHGLHFVEVCGYFGSFSRALQDLAGAAAYRSGSETTHGLTGYVMQVLNNLQLYFLGWPAIDVASIIPDPVSDGRIPMFRFAGMSMGPWWALVTALLIAWSKLRPSHHADEVRRNWHFVFGAGLVTSSLWFVVMVNHGGYHERFIYRHLFFLYFFCILFGAVTVRRLCAAGTKDRCAAVTVSDACHEPSPAR